MIEVTAPYRLANQDDAALLAKFVNIAGEGLPLYLWQKLADSGQSPWEIGEARAAREEGGFSYRNAILRTEGAEVVSCLIGYPLSDEPSGHDLSGLPPMFVPLQELEDQVPGTWYVNVVATLEEHRGKGFGVELLALADRIALACAKRGLSLIVADTNEGARCLYQRIGYREVGRRPMVKEAWRHPGQEWVLMTKEL